MSLIFLKSLLLLLAYCLFSILKIRFYRKKDCNSDKNNITMYLYSTLYIICLSGLAYIVLIPIKNMIKLDYISLAYSIALGVLIGGYQLIKNR